MGWIARLVEGLVHVASPRVCRICGCSLTVSEHVLCLGCEVDIPRANIHSQPFNEIHRRLGHHVMVDRAAGWFYYVKDAPYARLLVDAKYNDLPKVDYHLGAMCARELARDAFFDGIDMIVPMPMHWRKRMSRGYNQAQEIALGISEVTRIPCVEAIKAVKSHGVQSRHGKWLRYSSVAGTFEVRQADEVRGKHVLIVDDIITSGASMSEALRAISKAAPANISVLALGLTIRH